MEKFFIHETAVIGFEFRFLQGCIKSDDPDQYGEIKLPKELYVGPFAIIGGNAAIGERVIIDAYCKIDPGAKIGDDTLISYRATIASTAVIGNDCVVGGNVSEGTTIGDRSRSFGKLIHRHTDSTMSWDHHDVPEPGVTVHNDSFIGHDATVIGAVTIGPFSYICSGATITKDVPPFHIAYGFNKIIHYSEWKGELSNNPLFKNKP
jgi:UDP-3-O-[3-hydroxymyristoyl] glucosamine N-acyltransferase